MRLAAIDVGSNSILLLIAEVTGATISAPLMERVTITRLGVNLTSNSALPGPAVEHSLAVMQEYVSLAEQTQCDKVVAVATAAVREATNTMEFAALARERTGIPLWVIPAEEEARLSLLGVLSTPGLENSTIMVLDIGGGSTEFVMGNTAGVQIMAGAHLGSFRLSRMAGDAHSAADFKTLIEKAHEVLERELGARIASFTGEILIGVGGTITALGAVDMGLKIDENQQVEGHRLSSAQIREVTLSLVGLSPEERRQVPSLPHGREDTIIPGAAIAVAALNLLQKDELRISTRGLRYGVLIDTILMNR